jgi:ribonuclease HI
MKEVEIYTDGACDVHQTKTGGWCAIVIYGDLKKIISGGAKNTTNNQMELTAVIEGLEILKEPCRIKIYSDSRYVIDAINSRLKNWVLRGLDENYLNPDLWRRYIFTAYPHEVEGIWIRGHNGNKLNEECDAIAKKEIKKLKGRNTQSSAPFDI